MEHLTITDEIKPIFDNTDREKALKLGAEKNILAGIEQLRENSNTLTLESNIDYSSGLFKDINDMYVTAGDTKDEKISKGMPFTLSTDVKVGLSNLMAYYAAELYNDLTNFEKMLDHIIERNSVDAYRHLSDIPCADLMRAIKINNITLAEKLGSLTREKSSKFNRFMQIIFTAIGESVYLYGTEKLDPVVRKEKITEPKPPKPIKLKRDGTPCKIPVRKATSGLRFSKMSVSMDEIWSTINMLIGQNNEIKLIYQFINYIIVNETLDSILTARSEKLKKTREANASKIADNAIESPEASAIPIASST